MEQTVAVKELFDGLYNTIVGPGFYTVSGVKRKRPKVPKSNLECPGSPEEKTSLVSSEDSCNEGKECRQSTESGDKDRAHKSSAGSDSDIICDYNASNDINTALVSHKPSNHIPRTENTKTLEHKNKCDTADPVPSKQTKDDQGVCVSIKSKSYVTKEQGCASKYTCSKVPLDLTRSSRGSGGKSSVVSVGKADGSDGTSKQSQTSQGEDSNVSAVDCSSKETHASQQTSLRGADLTVSARTLGRPQMSPEKSVKRRRQSPDEETSVSAKKLHVEEKKTASILTDDGRRVTIPGAADLTVSYRRSSGKPQMSPEKYLKCRRQSSDEETSGGAEKLHVEEKTTASILKTDDGRLVTIPGSTASASRDADSQSDISTDSHASGYSKSRPAVLPLPTSGGTPVDSHRKLRQKTAPGNPNRILSSSPVKISADKSETKTSPVKRKLDAESSEDLCCKKVKLKSNQGSPKKGSDSKKKTDKHKKQSPERNKVRTISKLGKDDKDGKTKPLKQNMTASVKGHTIQSIRGHINLKKPKQCSNNTPAKLPSRSSCRHIVQRQLRSSTKNVSGKLISPEANKSSPRKPCLRGVQKAQCSNLSKQKNNRHHSSIKQKVHARKPRKRSDLKHKSKQAVTVKQRSNIIKHKSKSKRHVRRPVEAMSVDEVLAKQQQVIAEHSKEADKFEDGNIISALCQLEDRAKALHSHDLDLLMPMTDLLSANQNTVLGVRGQGQNTHPGGVWKKLIPEN
ncbi:serine/arginine repetitive matrix protein 2-like [Haliotis rufescens]|uniref:serine/arginine repetitive matrix protein 2-like n=1 Tax=Haliotis rufescens TaxID=6454 RepID=UPI00201F3A92|nr:serine/arginine repetitive matrix protein 2-like [Haliotis rufescens]XP_046379832.2 serine/arginine repetitive matrix protein 2-like [Haliotis rufescens]XP_048246939.1 serine/arginine repetitive matrix protein 2-like [Haliotis rufescens]